MLAAVSANSLALLLLAGERKFTIGVLHLGSLHELIFILLLGIAAGLAATAYVHLIELFSDKSQRLPFWVRTTLGGLLVGLCAVWVPQVMGIGYDTINEILLGELAVGLLAVLLLAKLFATAASVGLGIPGGTIGPALFIGATLGGMTAPLPGMLYAGPVSEPGVYTLIGMGAVMGAALQGPLAALTAVIELTRNPDIIMPSMLAIVVASLISSELFGKSSMFHTLLHATGLDHHTNPVMQSLRRIGAARFMNRSFVQSVAQVTRTEAQQMLGHSPEWIVIRDSESHLALMPAVELVRHLEGETDGPINLLEIPAQRFELAPLRMQATLQEALERLEQSSADALYIEWFDRQHYWRIQGILTREQIESAYRF
jgi:hypothetical protein